MLKILTGKISILPNITIIAGNLQVLSSFSSCSLILLSLFSCIKFIGIISIYGGYFVYFSPLGFPGKVHDKAMWDQEGLSSRLGPTEFGIADKGYVGVDRLLTPWKGKGQNQKQKYVFSNYLTLFTVSLLFFNK